MTNVFDKHQLKIAKQTLRTSRNMIIIKLFTPDGEKYARKPFFRPFSSKSNETSATLFRSGAKQFKTVKQAHAWLARRGFMRRTRKAIYASGYTSTGVTMPEPFWGFELLALDITEL